MKITPPLRAAYEINGQSVGQQMFYAVACDPRRNVVVEACAGAGKTWILVSRMLRALLDGAHPQEILAITFTKKAAGEMRQRLLELLQKFYLADDETVDKALLSKGVAQKDLAQARPKLQHLYLEILNLGQSVSIKTFHGWFSSLVKSAPLGVLQRLGLPIGFELLEDHTHLMPEILHRFQQAVIKDGALKQDYQSMIAELGQHNFEKMLQSVLNNRTEFLLADKKGVVDGSIASAKQLYPDFPDLPDASDRLWQKDATDLLWQTAQELAKNEKSKTAQMASALLSEALENKSITKLREALLTKKGTGQANLLKPEVIGSAFVDRAVELLMLVKSVQVQQAAHQLQLRLARLSRTLVNVFAQLKKEKNLVDMGDLELTAFELLSNPFLSEWVQARLDTKIRHFLIDEFQDTSPLQWHTLQGWLSNYAGAGGGRGSGPSLFIVGDPKQSIYGFRKASPEVFQAAKTFVTQGVGGDLLSCDHTRRCSAEVVSFLNQTFIALKNNHAFDDFRPHSTEIASHEASRNATSQVGKLPQIGLREQDKKTEGPLLWRDSLTTPKTEEAEEKIQEECEQVAAWITQYLTLKNHDNGESNLGDIMILAKTNAPLTVMHSVLRERGMASQLSTKNKLIEQCAVQDICALLSFLASPNHTVFLAQTLKSPIFTCSDGDLIAMATACKKLGLSRWWDLPREALPMKVKMAFEQLASWRHLLGRLSVVDAISHIFLQGDLLARYAASVSPHLREHHTAQLKSLLQAALNVEGGRYRTPYDLVHAIQRSNIKAASVHQENAISLLTIHGAKGLQAKCVIVIGASYADKAAPSFDVWVNWPSTAMHPTQFLFVTTKEKQTDAVNQALEKEKQTRQREDFNSLYVAATRAEKTLLFSSTKSSREHALCWWNLVEDKLNEVAIISANEVNTAIKNKLNHHHEEALVRVATLNPLDTKPLTEIEVELATAKALDDSLDSRIGQAMHKLLEYSHTRTSKQPPTWSEVLLTNVQSQFLLAPKDVAQAKQHALTILNGQGAWAWDKDLIEWADNEVGISTSSGEMRIDRLVKCKEKNEIWVLDFKLNHHPFDDDSLCFQLALYRRSIARRFPNDVIKSAFLSANGRIWIQSDESHGMAHSR